MDLCSDVTSPESVDILVVLTEMDPWEVDFLPSDSVVDLGDAVLNL